MLILTADQVKSQPAFRRQNSKVEKLMAIAYREWLFIQGESYPAEEKTIAIQQTREKLDAGQMCILVRDEHHQKYVVCYQDQDLEPLSNQPLVTGNQQELASLVKAIREAPGLIKNNRHQLRVYPQSIVGTELVDWLCDYLHCSRQEAVEVGQSLIEQGWLHHAWDKHDFKDQGLFYRFYEDERLSIPFVTG